MLDMSFGIFPIMTIIAGMVLGILAARFVYVDKQYDEMIKRYETTVEEIMSELEKRSRDETSEYERDVLDHVLTYKETIGTYRNRQENNRYFGAAMDIMVVLSVIITGLLTATQLVEVHLVWLSVFLVILLLIPLVHFWMHMRTLKQETAARSATSL